MAHGLFYHLLQQNTTLKWSLQSPRHTSKRQVTPLPPFQFQFLPWPLTLVPALLTSPFPWALGLLSFIALPRFLLLQCRSLLEDHFLGSHKSPKHRPPATRPSPPSRPVHFSPHHGMLLMTSLVKINGSRPLRLMTPKKKGMPSFIGKHGQNGQLWRHTFYFPFSACFTWLDSTASRLYIFIMRCS